jgi:subtilisin family serine protease
MGTAPEASYYLFRTENVYSEYPIEGENWIAAAERADSAGVDIITASLGYGSFDDETMSYTYSDMDGKTTRITKGAEIAFSKGIFLVNSAGNEGTSTWHYITAPSDGEHVLCVGAVAANKIIAPFSSRGPSADNRVKPDVTAMGMGTALIYADGTVGSGNGTSYSCPVMAGMIACLLQALPEKSNIEILNLVREISDRYDTPDNDYGYGIPDFSKLSFLIDSSNYNKESDDNIVAAYPNPFVDKIKLNLFINKSQTIKIVLYNNFGEKVYYTEKHFLSDSYNLVILGDLPKLQRGFYFLSVYTEQKILSAKIVKE